MDCMLSVSEDDGQSAHKLTVAMCLLSLANGAAFILVPTDVPPSYSAAPSSVEAATSRHPQTYLPPPSAPPQGPNAPQHNPYSYNPPAGALPPPPPAGGGLDPNSPSHHSQAPYFSPPPPPQQQHQQPYYGGAGPSTNYGATNNNNLPPPPPQGYYYDNNGQPYQPVITAPLVPRAPHGRRRRESDSSDSESSGDEHHPHRRTPHPRSKANDVPLLLHRPFCSFFLSLLLSALVFSHGGPDVNKQTSVAKKEESEENEKKMRRVSKMST